MNRLGGHRMQPAASAPFCEEVAASLRDRSFLFPALLTLLVSVSLRVVIVASIDPVLFSDQRDYYVLARNLLAEGRYVQVYSGETEAFEGFTFRAYRPPGYPAFLAGVFALFGERAAYGLAANVACDLVTQIALGLIALRLLGRRSALVTIALLATHVVWTPLLLSEAFHTMLFSLLALGVVCVPTPGSATALLWGVLVSVALFTRPITVAFAPVTLLRYRHHPARWRTWALLWLPAVIGLGIWTGRNYLLFGQIVPMSTNLGWHNAMDFGIDKAQVFTSLRDAGHGEAAIHSFFLDLERQITATRGLRWYLGLVLQRGAALFSLEPPAELWLWFWEVGARHGFVPPAIAALHQLLYQQYLVTYVAAAAGMAWSGYRRQPMNGLWALAIVYVLTHAIVSRGDVRFFAPLYPIACLFAASPFASRKAPSCAA